jgi:hypothetical protein
MLASLRVARRNVDEDMLCPISCELMKDPVLAQDGHTYERCCIEQWFATGASLADRTPKASPLVAGASTSPLTNDTITRALLPNIFARRKIAEFLDACRQNPGGR